MRRRAAFGFGAASLAACLLGCSAAPEMLGEEPASAADAQDAPPDGPIGDGPAPLTGSAPGAVAGAEGDAGMVWGKASHGLRLGMHVEGNELTVHIRNVSDRLVQVSSSGDIMLVVEGGEVREWWSVPWGGSSVPGSLVDLEPGEDVEREVDLEERAALSAKEGRPIAPGVYRVTGNYTMMTRLAGPWWMGSVEAGPVLVTLR